MGRTVSNPGATDLLGSRGAARRRLLTGAAGAAGIWLAGGPLAWAKAEGYSRRAIGIVEAAGAIDMLAPLSLNDQDLTRWISSADGMTAAELARFRTSGIKVMHQSIGFGGPDAYTEGLNYFATVNAFISRYADTFFRVARARDLDVARTTPRIGIIPGVQDSDHFRTPDDVKLFYGLGQRVSQLTYNAQNLLGCGCTERHDCGITDFGVSIIEKMNEVGMLVDVSHCGDLTTLEAFEVSKKPVAITHSNCRALFNHPRLKTDEAIRKMAAKGGVMGITGVRMFVRGEEPTTLDHIVDHIEHVAKLVGVEHVGIGTDSDLLGYDALPADQAKKLRSYYKASYGFRERIDIEGFDHPRKLFDLTEALLRRGFGDADIGGILGGNFRRLLGQVWEY
ncbi:MAG: membrane dipeptidase [Proteobacteria bacterium]|nr:membrane dipeptidase [Pseudomonadota bacterium]